MSCNDDDHGGCLGGSDDAYTYNFEGGVILTVFGINFDYQAEVVVGGLPCQINGTYYINTTSSPESCYQPPYVCSGGANARQPCDDIDYSTDCPGGTCIVSHIRPSKSFSVSGTGMTGSLLM